MIRHLYTLHKIVDELQNLVGSRIVECFTQEKNSAVITIYDNDSLKYFYFSTDTKLGAFYLRSNFNRASRNSTGLFEFLNGQTIKAITANQNNRIINITSGDYQLFFSLYGGSKNNLIITDNDFNIIEAFKRKQIHKCTKYVIAGEAENKPVSGYSLSLYLEKIFPYLGKYYSAEFLADEKLDGKIQIESIKNLKEIIDKAVNFRDRILASDKCYIMKSNSGEYVFSLIQLCDYAVEETFDSVNTGVERKIRKELIEGKFNSSKLKLLHKINSQIVKLEKSLSEIEDNDRNKKRADNYRHWAELLISLPRQNEKMGDVIEIADYNGKEISIHLEADKTIIENANKYYEKARNSEKRLNIKIRMQTSLSSKLVHLNNILQQINGADNLRKLDKIEQENEEFFATAGGEEIASRFRVFELGEGYTLYVGKNAANNDELTMRFAKPNDLWFHARGSSGSHAVLRLNKNDKPPKEIIKKAAAVAAYYSGAKNAKYVHVSYTFRKYVNKPRGANPGSVTLSREEVIMVEPRLPQS